MPAIEIGVLDPLFEALSTQHGWIGLLLGLGGRETLRMLRAMLKSLREAGGGGTRDG